ncbi:hypothetical protein GCM10007972_24680 [Iodidimonas muriae]|uniref:DUF3489 domain-containing protein n=1 Tax=Iodidimonas muriae TaxID=261467 RepID=A0ABQ2LG29_9PROT|nr:DUF3489 domain-containing protein [Iodidimonas muriae]GGO16057.1 hypothetical protein GCM10007972_24680 [Iodidimonas muriae]
MTIKLSDTQLVILSAACQRDDRSILPLPANLKGGAASKVIDSLIAKGLIEQAVAKRGDPIWRESGDGEGITFVATDAAFAALGIEVDDVPSDADTGATGLRRAVAASAAQAGRDDETAGSHDATGGEPTPTVPKTAPARKMREGSKQAQLIAMLQRPEGASIAEIVAAFGWQRHTVRGAIAGALKKKLGLEVTSEKVEGRGRVYRLLQA